MCSVVEQAADFWNTPASRGSSAEGRGYEKDKGEERADDLEVLDKDYGSSADVMSSSASMSRCTSINSMDHLGKDNRDLTVREIGGASMPLWTESGTRFSVASGDGSRDVQYVCICRIAPSILV